MRPPAPVHYLRPNHKVWTPAAVIFLDTETRVVPASDPEVQTLRLWVAHYTDRRVKAPTRERHEWGQGRTAAQLARWITEVTRNRESVWLYAHNLGFDLVTTRLPLVLLEHGWEIHDAAVGGKAPWLTMGKGKRVLTMCDSWSWLPMALGKVGELTGVQKPALPDDDDTDVAWWGRCRADVTILECAVLDLMDWWDRHELGRWAISGAACGWNAYRHTPTLERMVIDPDPAVVAEERKTVHGGRRGTWTIGDHAAGPFHELDFAAAYPTIAAHCPLPLRRMRPFDSLRLDDPVLRSQRWGVTARVRVRADTPRWPVRAHKVTWYPVGEFWTELAGADIRAAAESGALLEVGPGWIHQLGYAMAPWARWVLDVANGTAPDTPAVARAAAKSWGRAVIGKWASRGYERIKLGPAPTPGWGYEEGWDHGANVAGGMVDLAGQRWWVAASGTPDNVYPAVLAFVEAEVRQRLNTVIEQLGAGCVLQCDTDGVIVAERTIGTRAARGALTAPDGLSGPGRLHWCLDQLASVLEPLTLRSKRRVDHVRILGPQHMIVGGVRRYSGLPGMAEETAPGQFRAKIWPKLQWQMGHGSPAGYVRPEITPTVAGPWPTGWVLDDNTVVPVEAAIGKDGRTRLIGWESSAYFRAGRRASRVQHPALEPLL